MLPTVISHRLVLAPEAMLEGITTQAIVQRHARADAGTPMSGASLRGNAFLLVLLTVAAAIAGDWSGDSSLAGVWRFPAALLLLGLAYESWLVSRSRLAFELETPEQLYLGRAALFRFVCTHSLNRTLTLEVALTAPGVLRY